MNKHPLSSRLRPNVECAPWVIEEVKKLEEALARIEGGSVDGAGHAVLEKNFSLFVSLLQKEAREALEPKHVLYKREDPDAPDAIKDRNGDIALGLCRICGKGEAELAEGCVCLLGAAAEEKGNG